MRLYLERTWENLFQYLDLTNPGEVDEVIFTNAVDVCLDTGTAGRYWFVLWRRSRHCLAIVSAERKAGADKANIKVYPLTVPEEIWLHDQSKIPSNDRGWLQSKLQEYWNFFLLGYQRSTNHSNTAADQTYLDQFDQLFKQAVVKREDEEQKDFEFWDKALKWVNRYNTIRTSLFVRRFWTKFCPPTTVRWIDLPELAQYYPHLQIPEEME